MALPAENIYHALAGAATPAQRSRLVKSLSRTHNCTTQAIYKAAQRCGFNSNRKPRADRNTRSVAVTENQLRELALLIHKSETEKGRMPLTAEEAISIYERSGKLTHDTISPAYLNAWMRRHKISKTHALARTPHTRLMSLHPNHVHMVDASRCAQWYLDNRGRVTHQRRDQDVYSNKPGNPNQITRLLLVDHYSGAFFVWYTQEEAAVDWLSFLYRAWASKNFLADSLAQHLTPDALSCLSSYFPFRGLPRILYSDNGAPLKCAATKQMLAKMGIESLQHKPYAPRAKGANETMQRHWERWFEAGLKLHAAADLDELNAWAFDRCVEINAVRKHSRHGRTRFDVWTRDVAGHIVEVPDFEFYRSHAASAPEQKKVWPDRTIRFKNNFYRVEDVNLIGSFVEVSHVLFQPGHIRIVSRRTGQEWIAAPLQRNTAGFFPEISATIGENFRSQPFTDAQRAIADLHTNTVDPTAVPKLGTEPIAPPSPSGLQVHGTGFASVRNITYTHIDGNAAPLMQDADVRPGPMGLITAQREFLTAFGTRRADELSPAALSTYSQLTETITKEELTQLISNTYSAPEEARGTGTDETAIFTDVSHIGAGNPAPAPIGHIVPILPIERAPL